MNAPRSSNPMRRLALYLQSMYPPAIYIPAGIASYLAVSLGLQALAGEGPLHLTWRTAPGAASLVLLSLLLRIYDELKDYETDLRLGQAGDPRYQNRPIVTGEVTLADIHVLRWGVTGVVIALNLPLGFPLPLAAFLLVFGLYWCSFHWFFYPPISKNLILAFITHNPLALVAGGYVLSIHLADFGAAGLEPLPVIYLLVGLWMPVAAWETSRKIRLPEDETDYETYSKVLGWKVAAVIPAIFVALSVAALALTSSQTGLGPYFPTAITLSGTLAVGACLRLRLSPSRKRTQLRPYMELHSVVTSVGLVIALWLNRGVETF
ncbi:MAG: UbiA family prenyltransferase [Planctomycetota bacterium]|nr:UbiA family prenyltransferase [Planctomycetota bacterium]